MSGRKGEVLSFEAYGSAIADSADKITSKKELEQAKREARKLARMTGEAITRRAADPQTALTRKMIPVNILTSALDDEDDPESITQEMPALELVQSKNRELDQTGLDSFQLIDHDKQAEAACGKAREHATEELRCMGAEARKIIEFQKPEVPKPKHDYSQYNPEMWNVIAFWEHEKVVSSTEAYQIWKAMSSCLVHVPVEPETVRKLYDILEDERKTGMLLLRERHYWFNLDLKGMEKWQWLHDGESFHPVFSRENDFSQKVVKHVLLLLSAFRQHYPEPHWAIRLLRMATKFIWQMLK